MSRHPGPGLPPDLPGAVDHDIGGPLRREGSYCSVTQATARSGPAEPNELPATRPFESMAEAKARVSPGSVPRSVMRYDPEPVGVQTTARSTLPSAEAASPATCPASFRARASLVPSAVIDPRLVMLYDPEPEGVQ